MSTPNGNHSVNGNGQAPPPPPHDEDAERAFLGSLLIDPDAIHLVELRPEAFYMGRHKAIYEAMFELRRESRAIDPVTVNERMLAKGYEELPYILDLVTDVPTSVNLLDYESIVLEKATRRRIIRTASHAAKSAYDTEKGISGIVSGVSTEFGAILDDSTNGKLVSSDEDYVEMLDLLTEMRSGEREDTLVPSGFLDLDRLLDGGFERQALHIIAGRPGMGKSALEKEIRMNNVKAGRRVAHFNIEMSRRQVRLREIASEAKIDGRKLRHAKSLTDDEWRRVSEAIGVLSTYPNYVDDSCTTFVQIESRLKREHMLEPFDLVTIDYLQLLSGSGKAPNRDQEIGEITRGMVRLAKELDVPIIALAQISRAVEHRAIKRPILSDLRESGNIEQDSFTTLFVYRDEYYNEATERPNICEIEVAKNRGGRTGSIDLYFHAPSLRFRNLTRTAIDL